MTESYANRFKRMFKNRRELKKLEIIDLLMVKIEERIKKTGDIYKNETWKILLYFDICNFSQQKYRDCHHSLERLLPQWISMNDIERIRGDMKKLWFKIVIFKEKNDEYYQTFEIIF